MPITDYHVVGDANLAQSPSGQTTIVIQTPDQANQLSYNNTSSGLSATDVQSALDEIAENVSEDTSVITLTESTPYLYRQSKAIGDREYLEYIDGGSLGWNQLCDQSISTQTVNGVTLTNNNDGSFTLSGEANANTTFSLTNINTIANRKYLIKG
jgi:ketopantoate reductase